MKMLCHPHIIRLYQVGGTGAQRGGWGRAAAVKMACGGEGLLSDHHPTLFLAPLGASPMSFESVL